MSGRKSNKHSKSCPEAGVDSGRRAVLAGAAGGALGSLFAAGPAAAASGIGQFAPAAAGGCAHCTQLLAQAMSGSRAQLAQAAPATQPWWPSRWGADDQAGASNWINPAKILDALSLVKTGKTYELGRVYESAMPKFGDRAFTLRIPGSPTGGPFGRNGVIWFDEFLATEIGQVGTQFDGLGHIGVAVRGQDKTEMRFYNGLSAAEIGQPNGLAKLGIEHVKPIITRGVLLDITAVRGRALNLGEEVTVADIEAALQRQGLTADAVRPGDAVFFLTGWGALWNQDNAQYGKGEPGIGVAAGDWCIQRQVCVVGADSWGVEVVPNPDQNLAFPVHQNLITRHGIFIHENLDLAPLAADRAWQFAYVMLPLRIKGATGSPGRPIALV
ncbi:MAG: cyclase family protein [Thalassobaculales bacterium]